MKYILTKDDLLDLKYEVPSVKDFLKSKQPVEDVASVTCWENPEVMAEIIEDWTLADTRKYKGKNIKIYVEVI